MDLVLVIRSPRLHWSEHTCSGVSTGLELRTSLRLSLGTVCDALNPYVGTQATLVIYVTTVGAGRT